MVGVKSLMERLDVISFAAEDLLERAKDQEANGMCFHLCISWFTPQIVVAIPQESLSIIVHHEVTQVPPEQTYTDPRTPSPPPHPEHPLTLKWVPAHLEIAILTAPLQERLRDHIHRHL
jgi:hypothetical protein